MSPFYRILAAVGAALVLYVVCRTLATPGMATLTKGCTETKGHKSEKGRIQRNYSK